MNHPGHPPRASVDELEPGSSEWRQRHLELGDQAIVRADNASVAATKDQSRVQALAALAQAHYIAAHYNAGW